MRRSVFGGPRTRVGAALGVALLCFVVLAIVVPAVGQAPSGPEACQPTRTETLWAVPHPDGLAYGHTPTTATIPGPTLEMQEGECLAVKLINRTGEPTSIHAHGVGYTVSSDGTPHSDTCTPDGQERTYVFEAHAPTERPDHTIEPGSAGYWQYHDHCGGTEHGTGGINKGLFGAFIVRRPGDPKPDVPPFVLVMIGETFNLKQAPDTPTFHATEGQRVEFVIIGNGDLFHTFHLHGHRWTDNRTGIPSSVNDPTPTIDTKVVGPATTFGFQVIAGERVGPGHWLYHCHVQTHSDHGMYGFFDVAPRGGGPVPGVAVPPAPAPAGPDPAPAPGGGPPPSAPAHPTAAAKKAKKAAGLGRPQATTKGSRLRVSGRIAGAARGRITVTLRTTVRGGRAISVSRRVTPRKGRYALRLVVPRRATRATRAALTVRFAGDRSLRSQTRRVSVSARRIKASARYRP